MDGFFKAHSSKKIKSSKSKLNKSKIKLMLNGYEQNDNDAIRNAADDALKEDDLNPIDDFSENEISTVVSEGSDNPTHHSTALEIPINSNTSLHQDSMEINNHDTVSEPSSENSSSIDKYEIELVNGNHVESDENCEELSETITSHNLSTLSSPSEEDDDVESQNKSLEDYINMSLSSSSSSEDSLICNGVLSSSSSSSSDDFDNAGHLASLILTKLHSTNKHYKGESNQIDHTLPSASGYIKNKKIKNEQTNSLKSRTKKVINRKNIKEIYTVNASEEKLSAFPLSFDDYSFSTTKNISTNYEHLKEPIFKSTQLHHAQINDCSIDAGPSFDPSKLEEINQQSVASDTSMDAEEDITINNKETEMQNCNVKLINVHDGVIAIMSHPSTIYVHGKVNVKALCGTVQVMGYKLTDGFTQIYAPRFGFAQKLTTLPKNCSHYGLFSKLTSVGLPVLETEDIVIKIKDYDAILYMEQLSDQGLDFVENEFEKAEIFAKSKKTPSYEEYPELASKLDCSLYTSLPYKSFQDNPVWPEIVKQNKELHSKGIVCGGKGTGKSTFLKYYINSRVSKTPVLVLDLDPGQPEFSVAGNVSVCIVSEPVIGPNFTHLLKPNKMLNIGMINVLDNLGRYISAITELIEYVKLKKEFSNLPWMVNTMGMNNSIGLKVLTYIIMLFRPTFLVQMDSDLKNKCFSGMLDSDEIKTLFAEYEDDAMFENIRRQDLSYRYYTSPPRKLIPREYLTAKDYRYLSFLSYFGSLLPKGVDNLLSVRPYVIKLESIKIITNSPVSEDAITSVINGKIVAMCENRVRVAGNTTTMDDTALLCHGFGLIRGVDLDNSSVYITSVDRSESLSMVDTLLYCDCYPELTLSDAHLAPSTLVPYRAPLRPHNRQLLETPKRRFNPLQIIKMKKGQ